MPLLKMTTQIHRQSLRDLYYALRLTVCFIIAFSISFMSAFGSNTNIPYRIPLFMATLLQDNFGDSLSKCKHALKSYCLGCVAMYVVWKLGVGYNDYASVSVLFFVFTFYIAYVNPSPVNRRIAMFIPVVTFVSFVSTPSDQLSSLFEFDFLLVSCIAVGVVLVCSVFVLPLFSCMEIQERFAFSLKHMHDLLELLSQAVLASHKANAEVYLCEADSIVKILEENQTKLTGRVDAAAMEPLNILRRVLKGSEVALNRYQPEDLSRINTGLIWHLTSMMHACRNIAYNELHAVGSNYNREAFAATTQKFHQVISLVTVSNQDLEQINRAITELKQASDLVFTSHAVSYRKTLPLILERAKARREQNYANRVVERSKSTAMGSSDVLDPNTPVTPLTSYTDSSSIGDATRHTQSPETTSDHSLFSPNSNNSNNSKASKPTHYYDGEAIRGTNRLPFFCFLFHFSEFVQAIDNRFTTTSIGQQSDSSGINKQHDDLVSTDNVDVESQAAGLQQQRPAGSVVSGTSSGASSSTSSSSNTTHSAQALLAPTTKTSRIGRMYRYLSTSVPTYPAVFWAWLKFNLVWYTEDWRTKAEAGLRTSVLLSIGMIFVMVPVLARRFERGQWIVIAISVTQQENLGSTLVQTRNRLMGSLTGCAFSYFVYTAVGSNAVHMNAMFVPFVLVCGIVKQNKDWSYFATTSINTALVISFTHQTFSSLYPEPSDYAMLRIQENTMGVLISLVFNFVTSPANAVEMLKSNIVTVFEKLAVSTNKVLEVYRTTIDSVTITPFSPVRTDDNDTTVSSEYSSDVIASEREPLMITTFSVNPAELSVVEGHKKIQYLAYIAAEGTAIRGKVSKQGALIGQAAMELLFWARPFPEDTYRKLVTCEKKVLERTMTIDRALLRVSKFVELRVAENSILFSQQVSADVSDLFSEIQNNLRTWAAQMKENLTEKQQQSNWLCCRPAASVSKLITVDEDDSAVHLHKREQHVLGMERIQQAAIKLAQNSMKLNKKMVHDWQTLIAAQQKSSAIGRNAPEDGSFTYESTVIMQYVRDKQEYEAEASRNRDNILIDDTYTPPTDANIHHLFDILTTFNSLFFASAHLAEAAMDLGNTFYTILLLEKKVNHVQF